MDLRRLHLPHVAGIQGEIPIVAKVVPIQGANCHAMRFAGKTFRRVGAARVLFFNAVGNLIGSASRRGVGKIEHTLGHVLVQSHSHAPWSAENDAVAWLILAFQNQHCRSPFRRPGIHFRACNSSPLAVLHLDVKSHSARTPHAWRLVSRRKWSACNRPAKKDGQNPDQLY